MSPLDLSYIILMATILIKIVVLFEAKESN